MGVVEAPKLLGDQLAEILWMVPCTLIPFPLQMPENHKTALLASTLQQQQKTA
jgi:hypothetical protein